MSASSIILMFLAKLLFVSLGSCVAADIHLEECIFAALA